jgi:hypothetical protein
MRKPVGLRSEDSGFADVRSDERASDPATDVQDGRFRLSVDELIPGRANEVVLFNDSAMREIVLESSRRPSDHGIVDAHVTADGVDVSGFRYVRFADGLTIFHDPDTRIRLDAPAADDDKTGAG